MVPILMTLGSLRARVIDAAPNQRVERVYVFMHGFGAPGDDLVDAGRMIPLHQGTRLVFPEAPIDLGEGRAWWMIDWNERARYERSGDFSGYQQLIPPGIAQANQAVNEMLDVIEARWGVPADHIVLGGFSQGAMLALDVAAQRAHKPQKLVLLSGSLVALPRWLGQASSLKGTPVFVSHGRSDVVLPYAVAEQLRDTLKEKGALVTWFPFSGGHAIPDNVLAALAAFL